MISKLEEEEDDQEQGSPNSPALSSQSMEELYREVQELEQQEKRAMATRAAALQKAMSVTSNCPPGDKACGLAHLDVKWKTAKDKYEQAAFNDVMKDEKQRNETTEEGEAEFDKISKLADDISGVSQLDVLNNQSAAAVSLREMRQRATMTLLRKENRELAAVKAQEAKLRREQDAERQKQVEEKMKQQQEDDLRAMTYTKEERRQAKAEALREAQAAAEEEDAQAAAGGGDGSAAAQAAPTDSVTAGTDEYAQDVAAAARVEKQRQAAWQQHLANERARQRQAAARRTAVRPAGLGQDADRARVCQ